MDLGVSATFWREGKGMPTSNECTLSLEWLVSFNCYNFMLNVDDKIWSKIDYSHFYKICELNFNCLDILARMIEDFNLYVII